jgi:hypothetical protein
MLLYDLCADYGVSNGRLENRSGRAYTGISLEVLGKTKTFESE